MLPVSPYGQHKLMMEQLCQSYAITYNLRITVTWLFSVYGPNLRKQLLWDLCSRLSSGEQTIVLGGTGAEIRDWVDVRDVVRFLVKIDDWSRSKPFQIINGGSGVSTSVAEIAEMLTESWGGDDIAVKFSGVVRAGDPFSLVADSAFADAAGFVWQIPVDKGLSDYVCWFKDHVR
jgi:UDP-glucose 4-epimerase